MGRWLVLERRNPRRVQFDVWRIQHHGRHLLLRRRGGPGRLGPNLRRHPPRRPGDTSAVRLRLPTSAGGVGQRRRVSGHTHDPRRPYMGRPARDLHVGRRRDDARTVGVLPVQGRQLLLSGPRLALLLPWGGEHLRCESRVPTHLRQARWLAAAVAAAAAALALWLPRVGRRRIPGADQFGHHLPNGRACRRHAGRRLGNRHVPAAQAKLRSRVCDSGQDQQELLRQHERQPGFLVPRSARGRRQLHRLLRGLLLH